MKPYCVSDKVRGHVAEHMEMITYKFLSEYLGPNWSPIYLIDIYYNYYIPKYLLF